MPSSQIAFQTTKKS
uniref:Uncharacterized protein n=1 Tax=Rhizophora mucronata TaxID=61149 RepID=A0A2P2NN78_RHIMU